MAKKKKNKRNDARGYGQVQRPPAPPSKTTSPKSNEADNKIATVRSNSDENTASVTSLVGKLADASLDNKLSPPVGDSISNSTPRNAVAPERFASRLAGIVDRLEELGFLPTHIEGVVVALEYAITLETALDWLCLNLSTLELPSLFTDGALRDALLTKTTADSLTVLRLERPPQASDGSTTYHVTKKENDNEYEQKRKQEQAAEAELEKRKEQERIEAEAEQAKQKAWLLQQYQFEDSQGGQNETEIDTVQASSKQLVPKEPGASNEVVESERRPWADDEERLAKEELEMSELEADVNNEANNYMRSKQEIKQIKNELKKKRQQVRGIQQRIERAKAKHRQMERETAQVAVVQESEGEEEPGDFLNMFNGDNGEDEDEDEDEETIEKDYMGENTSSDAAAPTPAVLTDATLPSQWSGTTPQKTLEDHCRKKKLPRPKFTKLSHNQGFELRVVLAKKANPRHYVAKHVDFVRGSSLKDYMALEALYEMDSSLPLYRMFPPSFRDHWLAWQKKILDAQSEVAGAKQAARQQELDRLVSLVQKSVTAKGDLTEGTARVESSDQDHSQAESLESRGAAASGKSGNQARQLDGTKLRKEFQERQQTSAYREMLQNRSNLPMTAYKSQLLECIRQNPVTILSAQTGAGKTTQCPQFLMEEALEAGSAHQTQILVTQPRRVAATSVAERVSEEMCEPRMGRWVGYQIRNESKRSVHTKLLFCTTGVVLRRLQEDRALKGVTHVLVDEVHERQQQTDVLLIALRQLLQTSRPDLKIVLMSATLDSELFCSFFAGAPLVTVPGRTFPVSNYHLEDLMDATDHIVEEGSRYALRTMQGKDEKATLWVTNRGGEKHREVVDLVSQTDINDVSDTYSDYKMSTRRSMDRVNEEIINYDLLEDVLALVLCRPHHNKTLLSPSGSNMTEGSVLIFMPGIGEIRSMTERLEGSRMFRDKNRFEIIPMHSTLSSKDQKRAFVPARTGCRKIILSTNIAETSVTIPDVVCVIDTGRVREVRRNQRTSTSILVTDWCSKASAKQRAGRAGRVQPGICLKMYSSQTATSTMKPSSEPELRRVPLEEICLSILASGYASSAMNFLAQAPQPPPENSVKAAVDVLAEVGAIEVYEDPMNPKLRKEKLTALGKHLSRLPVDVRLGKILIYGALFRCLDKALTVAASLSAQSPFATFVDDASVAQSKQRAFSDPDSDFITLCNVWESYADASNGSTTQGRKFCKANYLNYVVMREIGDSRRQFLDLLCNIGLVDRAKMFGAENGRLDDRSGKKLRASMYNTNGENFDVIHAVFCAGLYPNVAHLQQPTSGDYTLFHKQERLYFHKSSVNGRKKRFIHDSWVVFHEKFGTQHRVSVSTTCLIHPFALLLLGGSISIRHLQRSVLIDDWIEVSMAAQVSVVLRELRQKLDGQLEMMVGSIAENQGRKGPVNREERKTHELIGEIVNLLVAGNAMAVSKHMGTTEKS